MLNLLFSLLRRTMTKLYLSNALLLHVCFLLVDFGVCANSVTIIIRTQHARPEFIVEGIRLRGPGVDCRETDISVRTLSLPGDVVSLNPIHRGEERAVGNVRDS